MSAAQVDEFSSINDTEKHNEIIEERSRILDTVSRKAQNKTLTLQETTDLYAKFNSTFESGFLAKKRLRPDDESWALKLLEEAEKESDDSVSLETRVNGIPLDEQIRVETKSLSKPTLINKEYIDSCLKHQDESACLSLDKHPDATESNKETKSRLVDSFIYEQFSLENELSQSSAHRKTHQALFAIMFVSTLATMLAIAATSWLI
ncbi:MAG: hypothetical protein ACMZ64_08965 [Oleiphilus sp.]